MARVDKALVWACFVVIVFVLGLHSTSLKKAYEAIEELQKDQSKLRLEVQQLKIEKSRKFFPHPLGDTDKSRIMVPWLMQSREDFASTHMATRSIFR